MALRWRSLVALGAMLLIAGAASIAAEDAGAEYWTCNAYASGQPCYGPTGRHGNIVVNNSIAYVRYNVCAKGTTEANNTRVGSGDGCAVNATSRRSCFSSPEPSTWAYGYWAGTGGNIGDYPSAYVPSDSPAGC